MKKLLKITFTLFITLIIVLGFAMPLNPIGNWYQQLMPNLGTQQINDITFLDSLKGFAVASRNVNPDTSSILRTTNAGDNWQIIFTQSSRKFSRIKFINNLTGFISGGSGSGTPYLYKTIDGGNNWNIITGASLGNAFWSDMAVINEDTIWLVDANGLNGGVFFTSTSGASWVQQFSAGSQNPNHIYMVNGRIGFIAKDLSYLRRTTNSGVDWDLVPGADGFLDMQFFDTLTGWKCVPGDSSVRKTTNGGLNWFIQRIPMGGILTTSQVSKLSIVNKDTIWGTGGQANISGNGKGVIYRTTNGGDTWKFQIPDTNFAIGAFGFIQFINKNTGWASGQIYNSQIHSGIHTTNGGDTSFLVGLQQISNEVPKEFKLYQNYPNPFNPNTKIKFQLLRQGNAEITIYDIAGRRIQQLLNDELNAGEYKIDFNASGLSSGTYFYKLTVTTGTEVFTETKKMLMIK